MVARVHAAAERHRFAAARKKSGVVTGFPDLTVWLPGGRVVLIEMKKRGTDLSKHYRQAFDYWTRLVPGRPRYVVQDVWKSGGG